MTLKEKVINTFKTIIDPEVRQNVWDLQLIYDLTVDEENKKISFKFKPTVPTCPIGFQLAFAIKKSLREIEELKEINMLVTDFVMADQANEYLKSV